MKKRPTAEQTLAEYVDRSILDGYSRELYPALLGACKQYGFSCFRAGLDQGIAIGMSHAAPEPEPEQYIVSSPALRIAIRALLTPAALFLSGIAGAARSPLTALQQPRLSACCAASTTCKTGRPWKSTGRSGSRSWKKFRTFSKNTKNSLTYD